MQAFREPERIELDGGELLYWAQYFPSEHAQQMFELLRQQLAWQQPTLRIMGKQHPIPRFQAWHGDEAASYRYSGRTFQPAPWTEALDTCRGRLPETLGGFNSVLANWYQHGQHSMGMHSDDEPELGERPTIAALSFGYPRTLVFKHKKTGESLKIAPKSGSLLVMRGETQDHWRHGINKTKRSVGQRISLTFRNILI